MGCPTFDQVDTGAVRVARGCGKVLALTGLLVVGLVLVAIVGAVLFLRDLDFDFGLGDDCRGSSDRLIQAAALGDRATVAEELRRGGDPDRVVDGESALACAAAVHEEDIVALLLDEGATPTREALRAAVGASGGVLDLPERPPVPAATDTAPAADSVDAADAAAARQEVVRLLLDHGADADGGPAGPSPLLYAVWSRQAPVVDLLLAHGADPDHGGRVDSVLVDGARTGYGTGSTLPPQARAQLPRTRGDEVANVPPLVGAAWTGDVELARHLLDAGADPDLTSDEAFSPLYAAAVRGDRAMVELLLARGAAPAPTVRPGVRTPAEAASAAGHPELVPLLTGGSGGG